MIEVEVEGFPAVSTAPGRTLLEVCESGAIPMDSACGGFAACNSCRVEVLSDPSALSPRQPEEEPFLDAPNQRLGCQARALATVRVRLAPGA